MKKTTEDWIKFKFDNNILMSWDIRSKILEKLLDKKVIFREWFGSKRKVTGIIKDIVINYDNTGLSSWANAQEIKLILTNRIEIIPDWKTLLYLETIERVYNELDPYGEEDWEN